MFSGVKRVSLSSFLMFKLNNVSLRGTSNLLNTTQTSKECAILVHTMESNELVSFEENPCTDLYALCFYATFKMLDDGSKTVVKCLNLIYTHSFRSCVLFRVPSTE